MRTYALASLVILGFGSRLPAQDDVNRHLEGWDQSFKHTKCLSLRFELVRETDVFKRKSKATGQALLLQPSFIRCVINAESGDTEAYICNEKFIYHYAYLLKEVTEVPVAFTDYPKMMFDLVVGMTAVDAKKRFQITLLKSDSDQVVRLELKPITDKDKKQFDSVRVSLNASTYLVSELLVRKPNGDSETWVFKDQKINQTGIERKFFKYEEPGNIKWTFRRLPAKP